MRLAIRTTPAMLLARRWCASARCTPLRPAGTRTAAQPPCAVSLQTHGIARGCGRAVVMPHVHRRSMHDEPSLKDEAVRAYLDRVLERRRDLQTTIVRLAEEGDSESVVEKTQLLAKTDALAEAASAWFDLSKEMEELEHMQRTETDPDLKAMAVSELKEVRARAPEVEQLLLSAMVPHDDADDGSAIVEIRAGTGGTEAAIFAKDLYKLYQHLAVRRGWRVQEMTTSYTEGVGSDDGLKEVTFSVNGQDAFGSLKFESGVHRVQRVPITEAAGRIHTSTATVAVLPQASEVTVSIHERDIKMDTYRSGGAGGQHVNTTDSAVRLTHIPTGIVVAVQSERSQHRNRDVAMKMIRARVYQQEREKAQLERAEQRRALIGGTPGSRSDRIRTYNFPQDRVTDHRVNVRASLSSVLEDDGLDGIISSLRQHDNMERLLHVLEEDAATPHTHSA
ncbi:peptide chain release factor 2 [Salpingoeca rosetta]|uniref:Peptide chain release factor 2 n=1 Tax=Salpingoeca rosetta (strain ATCC 50818 / BSB-021) TaxID=946362 RepID=F2U393_SALR5|nr:peptide chain release factor 2 [Salpingoeca rosetta]EGD82087.1 peptide chain release factor 2 [Salpingoeca rosetta]|eukprot:XP_004996270.1 peptide chain release factor 2 [Salpingoeca rosetta]